LHSTATTWKEKVNAALEAGCTRFDGAIKGIGGCPMADDVLVGNINTEWMTDYFGEKGLLTTINKEALQDCVKLAEQIFRP
jgi:hydroxymethylglutaryl-CoA lyase